MESEREVRRKELLDEAGASYGWASAAVECGGKLKGWDAAVEIIGAMAGDAFRRNSDGDAHRLRALAGSLAEHPQRQLIKSDQKNAWETCRRILGEADALATPTPSTEG